MVFTSGCLLFFFGGGGGGRGEGGVGGVAETQMVMRKRKCFSRASLLSTICDCVSRLLVEVSVYTHQLT